MLVVESVERPPDLFVDEPVWSVERGNPTRKQPRHPKMRRPPPSELSLGVRGLSGLGPVIPIAASRCSDPGHEMCGYGPPGAWKRSPQPVVRGAFGFKSLDESVPMISQ